MLVNLKKAPYNPVQQAETGRNTAPSTCIARPTKRDEYRRHHAMPSSILLIDTLAQLRPAPDASRHTGFSR
jgi:hypothetical protein